VGDPELMSHQQARRRQESPPQSGTSAYRWTLRWTFCAFIIAVAAFGAAKLFSPQTLPIMEVRIEGEFRQLAPVDLKELVVGELDAGFFGVDVAAIRSALLEEPWINDVSVRRIWPDTVQVTVYEQRAVAVWGKGALLNSDGTIFAPAPASFPQSLVQLTGPQGSHLEMLDRYQTLQELLQEFHIDLASITLNARRAWRFDLIDGPTVILGRKEVDRRIKRFRRILVTGLEQDLENVETVDLRYTNGVAVRMKEPSQV